MAAKIDAGGRTLRDCIVLDLSEGGARIAVENPQFLPDSFAVLLTPRGLRRCRLIWRSHAEIGVEFDSALSY
jgi:hypothetical protein